MEELEFNSTNLESGRYDKKNQRLYITFVRTGKTYVYTKVPEIVKEQLVNSSSPGQYFAQNIKNKYNAISL